MTENDGGPAFPGAIDARSRDFTMPSPGMSLRDWFATFAPPPRRWRLKLEQDRDRARNPHNDSYKPKIRSEDEIVAALRFEHADAMLAARSRP